MTHILVIDNYDSFVYTLNGYLLQLGATTDVARNDAFAVSDAAARIADYDGVLLSPGPGTPAGAGVSIPIVSAALESGLPLLGVCLGHQAIAETIMPSLPAPLGSVRTSRADSSPGAHVQRFRRQTY